MPEPIDANRAVLEQPTRDAPADTAAKQDQFLIQLLAGRPLGEAAKAAGVSRSTGLRWRQDPAFAERFRDARAELLQASISDLHAAAEDAVATLRSIATDPEARGNDRVQGARWLLDLLFKGSEQLEFAERLSRLEQIARGDKPNVP